MTAKNPTKRLIISVLLVSALISYITISICVVLMEPLRENVGGVVILASILCFLAYFLVKNFSQGDVLSFVLKGVSMGLFAKLFEILVVILFF